MKSGKKYFEWLGYMQEKCTPRYYNKKIDFKGLPEWAYYSYITGMNNRYFETRGIKL